MSKVTGKDLQRLIEGALNEKYEFKGNADDFLKNLGVRNPRIPRPKTTIDQAVEPIQRFEDPKNKYSARGCGFAAINSDDEMKR